MIELSAQSLLYYRLHSHNLGTRLPAGQAAEAAGACGMQNTPPGVWETALFNRVEGATAALGEELLTRQKTLLQAWSIRGAPLIFPAEDSAAFLSALIPHPGEEWVYTHGIFAALEHLGMSFDEVLAALLEVMPGLDDVSIKSKAALDATLAAWVEPLLPAAKRALWRAPSMYGRPDIQTVGGAAVSFLLRPCAFMGLVVFGAREGASPCFTSYKRWLGRPLAPAPGAAQQLARKYLHCYGPATAAGFAAWLGCTPGQARRMLGSIAGETETVLAAGHKALALREDLPLMQAPPAPRRAFHLLGPHDPYLDQRDRQVLLESVPHQCQIWKTVGNPGAILHRGRIIGSWAQKKKGPATELALTLWESPEGARAQLEALAEEYAAFRGARLSGLVFR